MRGFHVNWTRPFVVRAPGMPYAVEPFELLTTALSALFWRRENGSICMVCDSRAAEYYASLGLDFLWADGLHPLLDAMPDDINATAFWAAGKLYAVAAMKAPCVMLDTDLICWKNIDALLDGADAAAIHREDIIPSIYPGKSAFSRSNGFDFDAFDWSVQPLNTALCSFSDDDFRRFYADTAHPLHALCAAGGRHADLHGVRGAAPARHVCRKGAHPHPCALRPAFPVRRRAERVFFTCLGLQAADA